MFRPQNTNTNTNTNMNTNTNTTAIKTAARIASLLWESHVEITHKLHHELVALDKATGHNPKAMGLAIADAWKNIGANVTPPIRVLADACFAAGVSRKDASKLVNAAEWVKPGTASRVLTNVYGERADDSKSVDRKGHANKAKGASDGKETVSFTKSKPTVQSLIAMLSILPALSDADAEALTPAIAELLRKFPSMPKKRAAILASAIQAKLA
jgi:hypothetical protein